MLRVQLGQLPYTTTAPPKATLPGSGSPTTLQYDPQFPIAFVSPPDRPLAVDPETAKIVEQAKAPGAPSPAVVSSSPASIDPGQSVVITVQDDEDEDKKKRNMVIAAGVGLAVVAAALWWVKK